jgi:hypothetical protein
MTSKCSTTAIRAIWPAGHCQPRLETAALLQVASNTFHPTYPAYGNNSVRCATSCRAVGIYDGMYGIYTSPAMVSWLTDTALWHYRERMTKKGNLHGCVQCKQDRGKPSQFWPFAPNPVTIREANCSTALCERRWEVAGSAIQFVVMEIEAHGSGFETDQRICSRLQRLLCTMITCVPED